MRRLRRSGWLFIPLAVSLAPMTSFAADSPALLLSGLQSCGQGQVRVLGGLFHLADASLHLADCAQTDSAAQADQAKVYHIVAVRELEGQQVADGAVKLLDRNLGQAGAAGNNQAFDCMNADYPDLQAGDSLSVQYQPGDGLSLWRNGALHSHCPSGPEGAAYFVIWLGEKPLNEELKRELTGAAED